MIICVIKNIQQYRVCLFFYTKAHLEYNRRIQDADMLEKHIIQARLKASVTEEHVQSQLMEEVGESYRQLGLPPGTCKTSTMGLHYI